MAQADLQKKWEDRILDGRKVRDEWKDQFKVQTGIDYFEGKSNPGVPANEWININKIYSHLQTQLPKLYAVDPYFYVKVKKSHKIDVAAILEFERRGKVRQSMLNYLKVELGMKPKARLSIQDAHFAFGICKVRRASDLEEHPNAGETILDDDGNPLLNEQGEPLKYPDELPVNERYELLRVHPDDFIWDCDSGPLPQDWTWVAHHYEMSKQDAMDDPRFSSSAVRQVKPKKKAQKDDGANSGVISRFVAGTQEDADEDVIDIWEIYDIKNRETLTIAEDGKKPLIKPRPLPPGIEDHPFAILRFTLRDKSPYPIPPVFNAIDPQKELSLTRSRLLTHRKRFNRKYEVVTTKLDDPDTELEKLENGEDGTVIQVMANGAITPIKDAPLDQQNLLETRALDNDIVEAMGTPDIARGIASSDSATEASIMDTRLGIREGDRVSMVIDFITEIARKLDMLVQAHIDEDEAVKITGPQGEEWVTVRKRDYEAIEGEYEYTVNLGAMQPRLPDIERAQLTAFISQVVMPFPAILTKRPIVQKFAELYHIEDDAFIEALIELGKQVTTGMLPGPGNQGGGPSNNPIAQIMGMAGGAGGGNVNGGGA